MYKALKMVNVFASFLTHEFLILSALFPLLSHMPLQHYLLQFNLLK